MAEVAVSPEDRKHIAEMLEKARKDVAFRGRLAADPQGVLKEYKLDHLLEGRPATVTLDIGSPHLRGVTTVGQTELLWGFHVDANTGHADAHEHQDIGTPHADAPLHFDIPQGHADISHEDIPALHFDI